MNWKTITALLLGLVFGIGGTYFGLAHADRIKTWMNERIHIGDDHAGDDHDAHDGHDHDADEEEEMKTETHIDPEMAREAGIETEVAEGRLLPETLAVYGQVRVDGNKIARVVPRFGGSISTLYKNLGDPVKQGELLARVEANQSLVMQEVKSPIDGVIVERNAMVGETVGDGESLYTIVDLSQVWVDLAVSQYDQDKVKNGQSVSVAADIGKAVASGSISWISPLSNAETQTMVARVELPNPEGKWRPGLFVKGSIVLSETKVPVAVKEIAVQHVNDHTVVFVNEGDVYKLREVTLGKRGGGFVEITDGLNAGERYVSENSFVIKADLGKSGAAHEH